MSRNGERVGRRLARRHGIVFECDPINFRIYCDRIDVARNVYGGAGAMQWVLSFEHGIGGDLRAQYDGKFHAVEIGSDYGATEVLSWKYWHVYLSDLTSYMY